MQRPFQRRRPDLLQFRHWRGNGDFAVHPNFQLFRYGAADPVRPQAPFYRYLFDVLSLFRVAPINCDLFSFVVVRAYDDFQLPVTVQIQRRNYFVRVWRVEAIVRSYISLWVKLAFDQLCFHFPATTRRSNTIE